MASPDDQARAGGVMPPATAHPRSGTVPVWDPLVRVFHWSLVAAFAVAWLTGDDLETVHEVAGYTIAGLVMFRLLWGVVGPRHARFADFVYRPATVIGYLADTIRLRAKRHIGHNPAGGAMVIALLVALSATAGTGILMTTDAFWGSEWLEEAHEFAANLTLALVGLHVAGVLVASLKHGESLVGAMFTGRKRTP